MSELMVPSGADDVDADWLSAALASVAGGARVVGVDQQRIGNGMVADSLRLSTHVGSRHDGAVVVVAKVPAAEEINRITAAATRTYLLEATFYRRARRHVAVCRPACHHAAFDTVTGDYVVLLEDLAPAVAGDQVSGCTADEAAAVIPELAALHGPRWGDPTLLELEWLGRPDAESRAESQRSRPGAVPRIRRALQRECRTRCGRPRGALRRRSRSVPRPPTDAVDRRAR